MGLKFRYESPSIRKVVHLQLEGELLSGSVADHIDVTTMGQEVEDYDFDFSNDADAFNHQWY